MLDPNISNLVNKYNDELEKFDKNIKEIFAVGISNRILKSNEDKIRKLQERNQPLYAFSGSAPDTILSKHEKANEKKITELENQKNFLNAKVDIGNQLYKSTTSIEDNFKSLFNKIDKIVDLKTHLKASNEIIKKLEIAINNPDNTPIAKKHHEKRLASNKWKRLQERAEDLEVLLRKSNKSIMKVTADTSITDEEKAEKLITLNALLGRHKANFKKLEKLIENEKVSTDRKIRNEIKKHKADLKANLKIESNNAQAISHQIAQLEAEVNAELPKLMEVTDKLKTANNIVDLITSITRNNDKANVEILKGAVTHVKGNANDFIDMLSSLTGEPDISKLLAAPRNANFEFAPGIYKTNANTFNIMVGGVFNNVELKYIPGNDGKAELQIQLKNRKLVAVSAKDWDKSSTFKNLALSLFNLLMKTVNRIEEIMFDHKIGQFGYSKHTASNPLILNNLNEQEKSDLKEKIKNDLEVLQKNTSSLKDNYFDKLDTLFDKDSINEIINDNNREIENISSKRIGDYIHPTHLTKDEEDRITYLQSYNKKLVDIADKLIPSLSKGSLAFKKLTSQLTEVTTDIKDLSNKPTLNKADQRLLDEKIKLLEQLQKTFDTTYQPLLNNRQKIIYLLNY